MFKELLSIFTGGTTPLDELSQQFKEMLKLVQGMVLEASRLYWDNEPAEEQILELRKKDVQVNKLERAIRKRAATHLTLASRHDVPYALLMMSLVKDVERLGDYAKNLSEASQLVSFPLPEDDLTGELRDIRDSVENFTKQAVEVFDGNDIGRAKKLIAEGRTVAKRCDGLLQKLAVSEYRPGNVVKLTLGARYYKRIDGHLLNLISSLVMPLHKLDYFDETFLDDRDDSVGDDEAPGSSG
jgi:phosphate uptake regulator